MVSMSAAISTAFAAAAVCSGVPASAARSHRAAPAAARIPRTAGSVVLKARNAAAAAATHSHVTPAPSAAITQHVQAPTSLPKVYFLFMAIDKISNLQVWKNFFAQAPPLQYRAMVHCKSQQPCVQMLQGSIFEMVPTVSSFYCTDLVSPMNQLLAMALRRDGAGNPMDKFAFVSDSTLPAKPFSQIYSALVARTGSDFCVFPSVEWADMRQVEHIEVAPKHHQWVVLDRAHAAKSWHMWSTGKFHNMMAKFRMNMQGYAWTNNSFGDGRNFGCLDEFWHMAAIFGPITQQLSQTSSDVYLPSFVGGPLRVSPDAGWQGTCDTFVMWSKYLSSPAGPWKTVSAFQKFHASLDPPSKPHGGNNHRPGWWDRISAHGIRAIRQSDFLFVRKFIDNPTMTDGGMFGTAYTRIVFGTR